MTLLRGEELYRGYSVPNAGVLPTRRPLRAVDGVSIELEEGHLLGIVGESGSGKSTLLRLLTALEPCDAGRVSYRGRRVRPRRPGALRWFRAEVQLISQDPAGALNPRMTVGASVAEPLRCLRVPGDHRARVTEVLEAVGLDPAVAARRPQRLSGGQRQRVAIARAIAPSPRVLLADEPVSALDAAARGRVVELLGRLARRHGMALILVAHDLATVGRLCDHVLVMRDGRIVERGATAELFTAPRHPYTRRLLAAIPRLPQL